MSSYLLHYESVYFDLHYRPKDLNFKESPKNFLHVFCKINSYLISNGFCWSVLSYIQY